jgi:GDP-4-dehydro-6-deoxy-D-mannose reductase
VRVLVTGATGFVGRWLLQELEAAGHEAIGTPPREVLEITDNRAVTAFVGHANPGAVVHLAGMAYGPDARNDPDRAMAINAAGTRAVMEAVGALGARVPVVVASSSEVYGDPRPSDLPLGESAPLRADQPYGLSKVAQEHAAMDVSERMDIPLVIARAFNHTGPGQRRAFVVPALAARIVAARQSGDRKIRAGNVAVRRDFSDVRDVVRAYRMLVEATATSRLIADQVIFNVATGRTVAIRELIDRLAALAGIHVTVDVDPTLVRSGDPPEIRGDASRLTRAVGWTPAIELETTLADVLADVSASDPASR